MGELKRTVRGLLRAPGFTLGAALALALGIGANTAIFSLISAVLLDPLPFHQPERLVRIFEVPPGWTAARGISVSPGSYHEWLASDDAFSGVALLRNESREFTARDEPLVPLTHAVTVNYFDVLGVAALLGRTFVPEEGDPGGDGVLVLSHGIWQRAFGADPDVVGRDVELDNRPYTVVGVLRPDFYSDHIFATQPELWVPVVLDGQEENHQDRRHAAFGRLATGVSLEQAQARLDAVSARVAAEHPTTNAGWNASVLLSRTSLIGSFERTFALLLAAVGFVLLIACANVANLLLARATRRSKEVGIRIALGAGRTRVVREWVLEGAVLAAFGGGVAIVVAVLGVPSLVRLIPASAAVPFLDRVAVDAPVLGFAVAASLLAGLLSGALPALQASRVDPGEALRSEGRGEAGGRQGARVRGALVVAEFALSLVLLTGAGLAVQSFVALRRYEAGFDVDRLLHLRTSLRVNAYPDEAQWIAHFDELQNRLSQLPGAVGATGVSFAPPAGPFVGPFFDVGGFDFAEGEEPTAQHRSVLSGYFETMGIPILQGRGFDQRDRDDGPPTAIVNQTLVDRYFPDAELLGRSLTIRDDGVVRTIVGVAGSVRSSGTDPTPQPLVYRPYAQRPVSVMSMLVRTDGDPAALAQRAEATAWGMGRGLNVFGVMSMRRLVADGDWRERFAGQLLGAFAVMALVLAAAGIYSVLTYSVSQRVREIGVRSALGAGRGRVVSLVVWDGAKLMGIGAALGLAGSLVMTRVLSGILYGAPSFDALTSASVAALLIGVGLVACLAPAFRAASVDPSEALRSG